ncbi:MAG TPA: hypothetical protein EYP40_06550 [Chromatiales bacterium]|nr:hypothetical protein [Chromatiales bacterium]
MRTFLILVLSPLCAGLLAGNVLAREVAGVNLPETITLQGDSTPLMLNGAGIRSKFIFDIYVGALYLPARATTVEAILAEPGPKRVRMHFLYKEVSKDKLTDGWREGLENNLDETRFQRLAPTLEQFNALFRTVREGDVIDIDYLPGTGTRVWINRKLQGTVDDPRFYPALLLVWLGEDPADADLKDGMLGHD